MAIGSFGFASGVVIAAIFFAEGGDPLTLILTRNAGVLILYFLLVAARCVKVSLQLGQTTAGLGMGVVFAVQSVTIYVAITLIPVSVASLVEYTAPFQIAVLAWLLFGYALTLAQVMLVAVAAGGITLVLGVGTSVESFSGLGVFLAFLSSLLMTAKYLLRERMTYLDSHSLVFWMSVSTLLLVIATYGLIDGGPKWPGSVTGWLVLGLAPFAFLMGSFGTMFGIAQIGASRAAMMANLEPVIILSLAAGLLGERLSIVQLLGASLVLTAVIVFQWGARNARRVTILSSG